MEKRLTIVGNSMAVTLPAAWVKQHNVAKVTLQITDEGILIKPVQHVSSFQQKMETARLAKEETYKKIEAQANDPDTLAFYDNSNNTLNDVDVDIR
jgi:antitoxin component of MazEF toxin-antitoxin module